MSINQLFNINSINNNKKILKLKANDEELKFLSKEIGVFAIPNLEIEADIKRDFQRIIIEGHITCEINQECAISLEIIKSKLDINIKRSYEVKKRLSKRSKNKEIIINYDEEDEIEILEKEVIDIKFLILEELLLNINPYIRKES